MSRSEHARKPKVRLVPSFRPVFDQDAWWIGMEPCMVTKRDLLKKERDAFLADGKPNGPRPYQGKHAAIHEGLMDLMDVQDEQAIEATPLPEWEQELLSYGFHPLDVGIDLRGYDRDLRPQVEGAVITSSTSQQVTVVLDMSARAKAKHKAHLEAEMAAGVIYRDIDPYTLEPYDRSIHPAGFGMVRRYTSTSRRNHSNKSSWV